MRKLSGLVSLIVAPSGPTMAQQEKKDKEIGFQGTITTPFESAGDNTFGTPVSRLWYFLRARNVSGLENNDMLGKGYQAAQQILGSKSSRRLPFTLGGVLRFLCRSTKASILALALLACLANAQTPSTGAVTIRGTPNNGVREAVGDRQDGVLVREAFMWDFSAVLVRTAFAVAAAIIQEAPSQLSPRELFYNAGHDTGPLPSPAQARQSSRQSTPLPVNLAQSQKLQAPDHEPAAHPVTPVAAIPPVQNFGLRYNVLLVDPGTKNTVAIDPDRLFGAKECLALEVESNSAGYLYVFEQGTSGQWTPLFPDAALPDESNVLSIRKKRRIPADDCYEIGGDAGTERLFVVLSRRVDDVDKLTESIKTNPRQVTPGRGPVVVSANIALDQQIAGMRDGLQSRELRLKKISKPQSADEQPYTVYVVDTSSTASDRVVAEIRINHR